MPNDAKLGLVVGVSLVIAVAVVFFRKDPETAGATSDDTAAIAQRDSAAASASPGALPRAVTGEAALLTKSSKSARRHTVLPGETLYMLALRYYGDGDKFMELYRVNRAVLQSPDQVPPGTVLSIPELTETPGGR
jgi:nucleoid-associated protein YgaU